MESKVQSKGKCKNVTRDLIIAVFLIRQDGRGSTTDPRQKKVELPPIQFPQIGASGSTDGAKDGPDQAPFRAVRWSHLALMPLSIRQCTRMQQAPIDEHLFIHIGPVFVGLDFNPIQLHQ